MLYTATTNLVRVSVRSTFEREIADPSKLNRVFSYRVVIENLSEHPVQLLRRHWYILDLLQDVKEVEGEGVIGEQPIINAADYHEYESWCSLNSEIGKMWGYYTFRSLSTEQEFKVKIPEFLLASDVFLN